MKRALLFIPRHLWRILNSQISMWTIMPLSALAAGGLSFWVCVIGATGIFVVDDVIKYFLRRRAERKELLRLIERARLHRPNLTEARAHRE